MFVGNKPKRKFFRWIWIIGIIGVCLFVPLGRDHSPLMPWHTVRLSEEFTEGKRKSIQTFDQYLRLEERLFKELEQKVYRRVDRGRGFELNRYSSGSAADPQTWPSNWNRSFELPSDPPAGAVLLLHGMSDSPYSLRALGKSFNKHGYWVIGLRLPGHGTIPSGLKTLRWEDTAVVGRRKTPHADGPPKTTDINLRWPPGVISLSHIALPFPPDDPLYGQRPPADRGTIFLGLMNLKGERDLLKIPYDWLMRLRYNPFYAYLEERPIDWVERANEQQFIQ